MCIRDSRILIKVLCIEGLLLLASLVVSAVLVMRFLNTFTLPLLAEQLEVIRMFAIMLLLRQLLKRQLQQAGALILIIVTSGTYLQIIQTGFLFLGRPVGPINLLLFWAPGITED